MTIKADSTKRLILIDHTRQLQKRWLLQNSPIIPLGILYGVTLLYCPNVTTWLVFSVLMALGLYVIVRGAFFQRFLLDQEHGKLICEYRLLGMVHIGNKQADLSEAVAVTYSTWHTPYRQNSMSYHAAIYLRFMTGKPWRICDHANFSLDIECDEAMAEELAGKLGLPLLKDQHDPASNKMNV